MASSYAMRALFTQDMHYARPSSGGSVRLSPAVDAEAVCQQICSTTILHQGSHTTTHQMKPQSTVPNYETAWRKKLGRHTLHQTCTKNMLRQVTDALLMTGCSMFWLIDSLEKYNDKFPRTLIYCNSIKDVSLIYNYMTRGGSWMQTLCRYVPFRDKWEKKTHNITVDESQWLKVGYMYQCTWDGHRCWRLMVL